MIKVWFLIDRIKEKWLPFYRKKGNYSGSLFLTNDEECRRVVNILL